MRQRSFDTRKFCPLRNRTGRARFTRKRGPTSIIRAATKSTSTRSKQAAFVSPVSPASTPTYKEDQSAAGELGDPAARRDGDEENDEDSIGLHLAYHVR